MATTEEKNKMMRYNKPKVKVAVFYQFLDKHEVEFSGLLQKKYKQ